MPATRPILFITRNFPPTRGGIETMALEIVKQALAEGETMVVLHIGQPPRYQAPDGLRAYHHAPGTGRWPALLVSLLWVPWLTLRHRPRLLVNMQVTSAPGSLLAKLLTGVPYIVLCMGLEILPGGIPPWRWLRGVALRAAKRVISISRFTDSLAAAFRVPAQRREVINPGTRQFPDVPPRARETLFGAGSAERYLVLSLSRLVPRKGIDKAIEAVALAARACPRILLCVGGSGPDLDRLKALVASLGAENHVRFLGRIAEADMGPCYANADLFVLPSRASINPPDAEGFGIVFLEAGACGTPSVGGASGGVPDAVLDGKTGFLVDPENAPAIAEKILQLEREPALRAEMGRAAKEFALASSWDKACGRYLAAFRIVAG